ncbi:CBS domain-containing protein [Halolamina sp. C58]|uniref:CBS domain-containing protein n=1 Tax=Halolamina sp. C58 TaxID=3421640 RepID=UPI003EBD1C8A
MGQTRSDFTLRVEKIADETVGQVAPDTMIAEVAQTMVTQSRCARCAVVEEDDQLVGIITDRDLIAALLTDDSEFNVLTAKRDGTEVCAEDVMTPDPLTVSPDAEVPRVLRQMNQATARHVPVVEDESVVGIVTLDSLITHLAGEAAHVSAQMDNLSGIIRSESQSN